MALADDNLASAPALFKEAHSRQQNAARANQEVAFVESVPEALDRRLVDYGHSEFRALSRGVITMDANCCRFAFLICGEIKTSPAYGELPSIWQPFLVSLGLHGDVRDHDIEVTLHSGNARMVDLICSENAFHAAWYTDNDAFVLKTISPKHGSTKYH